MGFKLGRVSAFVVVRLARVRAFVVDRVFWRHGAAVVAVAATLAGVAVGALLAGGDAGAAVPRTGEDTAPGDVMRVQVWEDGSARVLSGEVTIGGEPWDLTGRTFCLYGEGCTDTTVPHVVAIPPVDGHSPCWGVTIGSGVAFCQDGYNIGITGK